MTVSVPIVPRTWVDGDIAHATASPSLNQEMRDNQDSLQRQIGFPCAQGASAPPSGNGLTGATSAARFVGGTAAGPPTSGTFAVGDMVVAQSGGFWVCTSAGTPGTWVGVGISGTAKVATAETTASTTYADLATTGPSVTTTIGASGLAEVTFTATMSNNTINSKAFMSVSATGFTAADTSALEVTSPTANAEYTMSATFSLTGLTAGSNTFTAKYRASANTASFANRTLIVRPK